MINKESVHSAVYTLHKAEAEVKAEKKRSEIRIKIRIMFWDQ